MQIVDNLVKITFHGDWEPDAISSQKILRPINTILRFKKAFVMGCVTEFGVSECVHKGRERQKTKC